MRTRPSTADLSRFIDWLLDEISDAHMDLINYYMDELQVDLIHEDYLIAFARLTWINKNRLTGYRRFIKRVESTLRKRGTNTELELIGVLEIDPDFVRY